jgi:hypothetical protein
MAKTNNQTSVQLAPVHVQASYTTVSDSNCSVFTNESLYEFFTSTNYKDLGSHSIFRFIFKHINYLKKSQQSNYHQFLKELQKNSITDDNVYIRDFFTVQNNFFYQNFLDTLQAVPVRGSVPLRPSGPIAACNRNKTYFNMFISMILARYGTKQILSSFDFNPSVVIKEAILTDNLQIFKLGLQKISEFNFTSLLLNQYYGSDKHEKRPKTFLEIIFTTGQKIARYFINYIFAICEQSPGSQDGYVQVMSEQSSRSVITTVLQYKFLPFDTYVKILKIATSNNLCTLKEYKEFLFTVYSDYNSLYKIAKLLHSCPSQHIHSETDTENFKIEDLLIYSNYKPAFKLAYLKNQTQIEKEYPEWIKTKFSTRVSFNSEVSKINSRILLKTVLLAALCNNSFNSVITDNKDTISELLKCLDFESLKTFHDYKPLLEIQIKPLMMFGYFHENIKIKNQQIYNNIINMLSEHIGGTDEYGPISIIFEYL